MTTLVGYLLVFLVVGVVFVFFHLMLGKLVRPARPDPEKLTIYECGEPTIGSAWIQFDLRFYVVALLFVIFDVEVAFFFPWAVVFGKANTVANGNAPEAERLAAAYVLAPRDARDRDQWVRRLNELPPDEEFQDDREQAEQRIKEIDTAVLKNADDHRDAAKSLAWIALWDILVFFGVLLVGFAYLWKRGDLHWVKAVTSDTAKPLERIIQAPGQ